jgi:hypothetical protein
MQTSLLQSLLPSRFPAVLEQIGVMLDAGRSGSDILDVEKTVHGARQVRRIPGGRITRHRMDGDFGEDAFRCGIPGERECEDIPAERSAANDPAPTLGGSVAAETPADEERPVFRLMMPPGFWERLMELFRSFES